MMKAISIPMAERTKQTSLLYLQSEVTVLQILSDETVMLRLLSSRKLVEIYLRWLHTLITMVTLFTTFLVGG